MHRTNNVLCEMLMEFCSVGLNKKLFPKFLVIWIIFEMYKTKLQKLVTDYAVLLVCVPLIIGTHWGWLKLQNNPKYVEQENKKVHPMIIVWQKYSRFIIIIL